MNKKMHQNSCLESVDAVCFPPVTDKYTAHKTNITSPRKVADKRTQKEPQKHAPPRKDSFLLRSVVSIQPTKVCFNSFPPQIQVRRKSAEQFHVRDKLLRKLDDKVRPSHDRDSCRWRFQSECLCFFVDNCLLCFAYPKLGGDDDDSPYLTVFWFAKVREFRLP